MAIPLFQRSIHSRQLRWLALGLGLAALVVGINVGISTWIQGYWGRDNAAMRYLFQCWGTPVDEQARWKPQKVLVSACRKPLIFDVSPSGRLAAVMVSEPRWERVILDAQSGQTVMTVADAYFVLALSDTLIYYAVDYGDYKLYDLVLQQELPITKLPFQSVDISMLETARNEAQGNYEYYEGDVALLVFSMPAGRRAFDIEGLDHETYLKLIADWRLEDHVVFGTRDRPGNSPFRGGSRSCVIGRLNPDMAGPGLLDQIIAHMCLFEYTNPILLDP